jgi:uncharacterized protein YjiS (DUF1127 family)
MSTASVLSVTLPGQSGGPIHLLHTAYVAIKTRIERVRMTEHLAGLDDRLLADMGLARRDIGKLFR